MLTAAKFAGAPFPGLLSRLGPVASTRISRRPSPIIARGKYRGEFFIASSRRRWVQQDRRASVPGGQTAVTIRLQGVSRPLLLLTVAVALAACRPDGQPSLDAQVTIDPPAPRVGSARVEVAVAGGLDLARVEVAGDMAHAGMIPVEAVASEVAPGRWVVESFTFTMAGDWVITVTGVADDGSKREREVRVTVR